MRLKLTTTCVIILIILVINPKKNRQPFSMASAILNTASPGLITVVTSRIVTVQYLLAGWSCMSVRP